MRRLAAAVVLLLSAVGAGCAEDRGGDPSPAAASTSSTRAPTETTSVLLPTITYVRSGGRTAPPDQERLEIASDGSYSLQRSVRAPTVGRFRGQLTAEERAGLGAEARSAVEAGPPTATRLPDAARETITIDSTSTTFGGSLPAGPWNPVAARLRILLVDLVRSPAGAVSVVVAPDASGAHLSQVGPEQVTVDLSALAVTLVLFGADGSQVGRWEAPAPSDRDAKPLVAEVGWTFALPFGHNLVRQRGQSLQVDTKFGLVHGAERIAVLATTTLR